MHHFMTLASPKSLGTLAWQAVESIGNTLSITEYGSDGEFFRDGGKPVIFALWHGRLFFPMYCRRNHGIHVLVSEHRDGDIIASSLDSAGFRTVRGSTTRGGSRALVKLIELVRGGEQIAFTPDGPLGPRWKFQPGAVYVAAKTGLPVVPITGSARRAVYFGSWDSFQLPLPFTRGVLVIGEPYHVTGGIEGGNIEFHRAELERRLVALALEADRLAGAPEGR
jgi:lysophospholipid acyltransferase (LPLAT)-like uncharacterized protein